MKERDYRNPLLLVVSGPSGSGKTTIVRELIRNKGYALSVSATTRPPRPGEVDGRDYHFYSRDKFLKEIESGGFLEYSEHFGNLYGTPREPVEASLADGNVVILEIDVNGAAQVKENLAGDKDALFIFINAPSREELRRRIAGRPGTQDERTIEERLARADMEIERGREIFDRQVINDTIERAVSEIEQLVEERMGVTDGRSSN